MPPDEVLGYGFAEQRVECRAMKALSLWQPWASAMAELLKFIETRSWLAPRSAWGTRIGLHAAQRSPRLADQPGCLDWTWTLGLPRGAIVATARLAFCGIVKFDPERGMDRVWVPAFSQGHHEIEAGWINLPEPRSRERQLGNYSRDRCLWYFEDIFKLDQPIPCRGFQRLWMIPHDALLALPPEAFLNIDPLRRRGQYSVM